MSILTGPVKNARGQPIAANLRFTPVNFPSADPPGVLNDEPVEVASNDGTFSITLKQGYYDVEIITAPHTSVKFRIAVPEDSDTYTIDELMSPSTAFALPTYGVTSFTSIKLWCAETARWHELKAVQLGGVVNTFIEQ